MLHLDADIVLPPHFRRMIENAELDPACLYGIDRVNCLGSAAWDAFAQRAQSRCNSELQYEWSCMVKPPQGMSLGARIAHGDYGGYCPIGFFQLWNPRGSGVNRYPITVEGDMEHTDVLFAIQWPRPRRQLLPEGFSIHLESSGEFGANWHGRKSPPFRVGYRNRTGPGPGPRRPGPRRIPGRVPATVRDRGGDLGRVPQPYGTVADLGRTPVTYY